MKQLFNIILILCSTYLIAQEKEFEIFNTNINTIDAEFGVTYINDNSVLFASSKKDEKDKNFSKNRREHNSQLHLELYHAMISSNGDLIQTGKFSTERDNKILESDISYTPDGKTIYFTWNNFYNIEKRKDSAKWKTLQLMKASINENFEVSNITQLPFNSEEYSVRFPEVSKDGKQLFFVSDMPNGFGENDIYVVDILGNNMYSDPKNLGSNINSNDDELYPFVDENNTIYFASYGHKGLGSLDIFKSDFKDGNYLPIENLPAPINSKYDDFAFVINNATNKGYFTSNRKGSKGDVDVYAFSIKNKEPIECNHSISGFVYNKESNKQLTQVTVNLYLNNVLTETQLTQVGSKFNFIISCEGSYKIVAEKVGFSTSEITISTDNKPYFLDNTNLYLIPKDCNQTIAGAIFNKKDNQQLSDVTVNLFVDDVLTERILVPTNSKYTFDIDCGTSYKILAEKEGFSPSEIKLLTNNTPGFSNEKNIILTPVACVQTLSGFAFNEKDNSKLSDVKLSLITDNQLEQTQLTNVDANYNFKLKCEATYKILAEKEGFEPSEITLTTDTNLNFKNTKNIPLTPIKCKSSISSNIVDINTKKPLTNAIIHLYQQETLVTSIPLNTQSTFNYNVACNTKYKVVAVMKGYENAITYFKTSTKNNEVAFKEIAMKPMEEFISVNEEKMIKTDVIYFDLDSYIITEEAAIEINKVIGILKKYPALKIEIASHTDSRAPDHYNLSLSEKRANSTIKYIISKGIDPNRLTSKGYGETKLVNKCKNGVPCTAAEHELNRRTEFIIIEE